MDNKFLYECVRPFKIGQTFGENKVCIDNETNSKYIHCDGHNPPEGYRSVYSMMKGHNGWDIPCLEGTPVLSPIEGEVIEVSTEFERGLGVDIVTKNKFFCVQTNSEEHFKVRTWHHKSVFVKAGQQVKTGNLIALADSTGISTGHHVHLEVKPVRKNSNGVWYNILQDNGYFGAVDPNEYYNPLYALEIKNIVDALEKIKISLASILDRWLRK